MAVRSEAEGTHGAVLHFHSEKTLVHADVVHRDFARSKAYSDHVDGGRLCESSDGYWGAILAARW